MRTEEKKAFWTKDTRKIPVEIEVVVVPKSTKMALIQAIIKPKISNKVKTTKIH